MHKLDQKFDKLTQSVKVNSIEKIDNSKKEKLNDI